MDTSGEGVAVVRSGPVLPRCLAAAPLDDGKVSEVMIDSTEASCRPRTES